MKITEEKHNHKLTNLLKVFIFSVLMILPFLNVAVRCGYVMLNKNAYQSYYGETINQKKYIQVEDYKLNNEYHFQMDGYNTLFSTTTYIYLTDVKNYTFTSISNSLQNALDENKVYKLEFTNYNNVPIFKLFSEDNLVSSLQNFGGDQPFQFDFTLLSYTTPKATLDLFITEIEYNSYSYLDNVFEYSINKLEEEQYIAWTQNTAVYQGVESMTTGLGITQTVIPMLIVYWFMLTIIYVIIDIVLAIFTKLTHMIGNKTT